MKRWDTGSLGFIFLFIVAFIAAAGGGYYLVSTGKLKVKLPEIAFPVLFEKPRASEKDFSFVTDETLRKHFVAQANVRRYRTKSGADFSHIQEGILTDKEIRFYVKRPESELTRVGSTVYVLDTSDNSWWKQIISPEDVSLSKEAELYAPRDFKVEYQGKNGLTFTAAGEEACGDMTCYKYEEGNAENDFAKRTFWVDKNKRLMRKEEVSFAGLTTITEYEYDGINIKQPDKTKDVPEGGSVFAFFEGGRIPVATGGEIDAVLGDQFQKKLQEQLDKQLQERLQKQFEEQLKKQLEERLNQQLLQDGSLNTPSLSLPPPSP